MIGGGVVENTLVHVPEKLQHRVGEGSGLLDPTPLEGRLVERDEAVGHAGVVLQVPVEPGPTVLERAVEPPIFLHLLQQEPGVLSGHLTIVLALGQDAGGEREGAQRQPVPGGQDLVVAPGAHPVLPDRVELRLDAFYALPEILRRKFKLPGDRLGRAGDVEDVRPLEVASFGDVPEA